MELGQGAVAPARGPLRSLAGNPRYFTDGSGKAILLAGSHIWDNRQDRNGRPFDWAGYLYRLRQYNHNFVRLWVWEQPRLLSTGPDPAHPEAILVPEVFARTGPGTAADGGLRFDLTGYNQSHFDRLRDRVLDAEKVAFYRLIEIALEEGSWKQFRAAWPFPRISSRKVPDHTPKMLLRGVVGQDIPKAGERRTEARRDWVLFSGSHGESNGTAQLIEA